MSAPIHEIRALLLQFERSDLKDLYYRSPQWSVFMARPGGGANPLLAAIAGAEPAASPAPAALAPETAPHLGLFAPRCAVGEVVEAGAVVAVIDVLGRKTDVVARTAGRVRALRAGADALVEYGDVLVELEAA